MVLAPTTWTDFFETHDAGAANNFLTALGCHTVADHGFKVDMFEAGIGEAMIRELASARMPFLN